MTYKCTSSVNAGVSIEYGAIQFIVDALFTESVNGFSSLDDDGLSRLFHHPSFSNPAAVCFTHCHADHFDRKFTEKYMLLHPDVPLFLPTQCGIKGELIITGNEKEFYIDGINIKFIRSTHEGELYKNEPHYCILITDGNFNTLVTGDSEVADTELAGKLSGTEIDLAILDFPWITLPRGRECILNALKPSHVVINHLPLKKDDPYGYRKAALKSLNSPGLPDTRIMLEPFQTETFES